MHLTKCSHLHWGVSKCGGAIIDLIIEKIQVELSSLFIIFIHSFGAPDCCLHYFWEFSCATDIVLSVYSGYHLLRVPARIAQLFVKDTVGYLTSTNNQC